MSKQQYTVRARLPVNSYRVGSGRHGAGKNKSNKWSLTIAEGGSFLGGILPSELAIAEAFKTGSGIENFENIATFVKRPQPILYTNRPFVGVNEPCDPPERNHLNQIQGSVKPSQCVVWVSQALARRQARRGRLTRSRMLRHMRVFGRSDESSSLNNPTPIAVVRVGGLCNFHCNLVDELGHVRTPQQLRLTAGTPLYVTLPAEDENGALVDDEFCLTPYDPAPLYFGSTSALVSELTRAVLQFLQLAVDHVQKDADDRLVPETVKAAEEFAWTFGDNAGVEFTDDKGKKELTAQKSLLKYDDKAIVQIQDVYDKLVEIVIAKIRAFGVEYPAGHQDRDQPASFRLDQTKDPVTLTGQDAFMQLLVMQKQNPDDAKRVIETDFMPLCERKNFDHFLGIDHTLQPDEKAAQRFHRFVGHLEAGVFPPFRAIREIKSFTADDVRRELMSKRTGGSGRSDLRVGRLVQVMNDDSVTVMMS
jgi:hypothetical protein